MALTTSAHPPVDVAVRSRSGPRLPPVLTVVSVLVVAVLLLPLAFLMLEATRVGWTTVSGLLFRHLTAVLLWNTVRLVVLVTLACAVIGTAAAWATERTALAGRRAWAVLIVLPVAIPDFVIVWGWVSLAPSLHGLAGAALVLTLGLYPLVYLPVAASFRSADPAQEEVARSLGRGPLRAFWSVTLRHARLAVLGGCLLVALYLLAEYGAFAIVRYQTFTTEIFTEFQVGFNTAAAAALSLVLVALGLVVLGGEALAARAGRHAPAPARPRAVTRTRLGWRTSALVLMGMTTLGALGVGVPVWAIGHWLASGRGTTLPAASSLADAAWHTGLYSASAAALSTLLALPLALMAVRHRRRFVVVLERSSLLVQALPGLVIALALVFFAVRYAHFAYQRAGLLVIAYAVMFFPLALVAVRAIGRSGPPEPGRGRTLARQTPRRGVRARHLAVGGARARGRVRPGVPDRGDRAHRHARARADGRADPGDAVLGVLERLRLRRRRTVRGRDAGHRGRPHLSAGTLVRPPPSPDGGAGMTSVVVSDLHKAFGPHEVLSGLDLNVPERSLTAVLGPSGSGKTTLLRILAGFERADQGRVVLAGQVVEEGHVHVAPERRRIGYVPQDGSLFPHLSAAGNIGFGLSRQARRAGRVDELLALVGLDGHQRRYPHQLSGGQQQRVALARALAPNPGLVLLDEPFSSLDASLRAEVRTDVQRVLRSTETTAVLVTHDQDEALSLADQVAVLRDGRVAQCGPPDVLYRHPADPAMARFVGDANLLEGTVRRGSALTLFGELPLRGDGSPLPDGAPVLVLVRPEQIDVSVGADEPGLAGRVVESHYYGHDAVITVDAGQDHPTRIRARLAGRPAIATGARVTLRTAGSVTAWPAHPSG